MFCNYMYITDDDEEMSNPVESPAQAPTNGSTMDADLDGKHQSFHNKFAELPYCSTKYQSIITLLFFADECRAEATFQFKIENISKMKDQALSQACVVRNLPW